MPWVSPEAIKTARQADLYSFLIRHHAGDIETEGNSIRLKSNHSVSLKRGYSGYKDWATGETGNAVDFLMNYLGYDLQGAVAALCSDMGVTGISTPGVKPTPPKPQPAPSPPPEPKPFQPPEAVQGQYRQVFAYLTKTRGIPAATVQALIRDNLLYQDTRNNAVFIDPARSFYEVRGTNTGKPFHQVQFSDPAAFWWIKANGLFSDATVAFVCESSIDAISLYLLRKDAYPEENGLFCGIGGVANQQRIDVIRQGMAAAGLQTVIAVDNDEAGETCRKNNPDCPFLIPTAKDWNEDLIARINEEG